MPIVKVVPTGQRKAFDIIDGAPDYDVRHSATAVFVHYHDVVSEARRATYANDPRPFGPTLRHCRNISVYIIDHFGMHVGDEFNCEFLISPDGSHHYLID